MGCFACVYVGACVCMEGNIRYLPELHFTLLVVPGAYRFPPAESKVSLCLSS